MKFGKIVIAGIAVATLSAILGVVFCGGIFRWVYALEPTNVWKTMDGTPNAAFFAGTLAIGIIFAFCYALINKGVPGKNMLSKGTTFGILVWLLGTLPGMLITHSFMTVANGVVIYWSIFGLFANVLKGMVAAVIYGE